MLYVKLQDPAARSPILVRPAGRGFPRPCIIEALVEQKPGDVSASVPVSWRPFVYILTALQ